MRIGRLDKLIAIERRIISAVSPSNEPIFSWEVYVEAWAEAYDVRSREEWDDEAKQRFSETVTRFRVHYNDAAGIDASMRVRFDGRLYDIKSIVLDHVRKQTATIEVVAQSVTVAGASIDLVMDIPESATVGESFQSTLHIFGGAAPFSVSVTDGSPAYQIPPGLNLVQASESTWSLEGFPAEAGSFQISFTVTDAAGKTVTLDPFILIISSDGSPE